MLIALKIMTYWSQLTEEVEPLTFLFGRVRVPLFAMVPCAFVCNGSVCLC
jgi:ABC-type transporter Mla maintaining outer membrane lipid asymmetry permease subunit MlaE